MTLIERSPSKAPPRKRPNGKDAGSASRPEKRAKPRDQKLQKIVRNLPMFIFQRVLTRGGSVKYPYISPRMREWCGIGPSSKTPKLNLLDRYIHPDDKERFASAMEVSAMDLSPIEVDVRLDTGKDKPRWLRTVSYPRELENRDIQWDGIAIDITRAKAHETHLAYHDLLTGLPNRLLFVDWLSHVLGRNKRTQTPAIVIALKLDSLADIRENSGFSAGDASIVEAARRLQRVLRGGDTIAYIGSGGFLIALVGRAVSRDLIEPVQAILRRFEDRFSLDGQDYPLDILMGVSVSPENGTDAETLIGNATTALNKVKADPSGAAYQFYDAQMTKTAVRRLSIESELGPAIRNSELVLYYQPQYHAQSLDIVGFEALVRWRHPVRGLIPPGDFIPIAEATGLIVPMGEFVLRQACIQASEWRRREIVDVPMSVNLSGWQLLEDDLGDTVLGILSETGLPANCLKLELTESSIVHNIEAATRTMTQLADAGVRFAVDDFGIEHSALSHLSRLPIETLKIDYSFISRMTEDRMHASLVQAIVFMTHSMNMHVVAEGVETKQQLTYLQAYQCDALQGFLFSKPITAKRTESLVKRLLRQKHAEATP